MNEFSFIGALGHLAKGNGPFTSLYLNVENKTEPQR